MFFEIWIEKKKSNFFFFRLQLFNLIIVIIHCTRPTICYDRCSRSTFVCCWRLCCAVGLVIHWHNLIIWVTQCQIDLQSKQKKYVQICCNCTWFTCIIWKKKKKNLMHTETAAAIGSDDLAVVPFVSPFSDCFLILDLGESSEMISAIVN